VLRRSIWRIRPSCPLAPTSAPRRRKKPWCLSVSLSDSLRAAWSNSSMGRGEAAEIAASCIHLLSTFSKSSCRRNSRAGSVLTDPSVRSSRCLTLGSGSVPIATSASASEGTSSRCRSASWMAFSRTPAASSRSAPLISAGSKASSPSKLHNACRRASGSALFLASRSSGSTAASGWRLTKRRCAVRRHQMLRRSSICTSCFGGASSS